MRQMFTAAMLLLLTSFSTHADDARTGAIVGVIQSQLDAFQEDDFAKAFTYASPTIKRMFGSPERFGQMVRNGFPMVWRPSEVQFLELVDKGGEISQTVLFRDAQGVPIVMKYFMVETANGWQIDGVVPVQAPDVAA